MDLSYWTNLNLRHSFKNTNRLFYGEYRYCASAGLDYAKLLRGFDRDALDYKLRAYQSLDKTFGFFAPYNFRQHSRRINNTTYENLHRFLTLLESINNDFKVVLGWHQVYVYTNDRSTVKDVLQIEGIYSPNVTEACITHPPKTIVKKSSKYRYRCYFKNTTLTSDEQKRIRKFFLDYTDCVAVSKTFGTWLENDYKYCRDYFFFDFNEPGIELFFEMILPGFIKERVEIITQD